MKKNDLIWRLSDLPDAEGVAELVRQEVITKDEARQILFKQEEPKKQKELEEEIKFLRKLVDKLTDKDSSKWTVIEKIYKDYNPVYPSWYVRYENVFYYPSPTTYSVGGATYTATSSSTTSNKSLSSLN